MNPTDSFECSPIQLKMQMNLFAPETAKNNRVENYFFRLPK